ncbi:MAG: hypothetical protein WDM91_22315 [Rhizomicrobium sp.]
MMPMMSLASLSMGIFLIDSASTFVGFLLILFGAAFLFLSAFGTLMCSSIVSGDDGIAAHNFGRNLRFIRWQDVTVVKKSRRWNPGARAFQDVFYVFDSVYSSLQERMVNLRGPIVFSDRISGLRDLLDDINQAAHQYHFPLVALDQEAARTQAIATDAGIYRRTVPKVNEAPLAEL